MQKYFSNASGTKTIKKNSWVKKALGHKLTYLKSEAKPTCTTKGHMAKCYQCTRCKKLFKDKKAKKSYSGIAALGHNRIYHEAVEATCQHAGNTAYYECTRCGKYFSDSDCTIQIKSNSWVTPAKTHAYDNDGFCTLCGANKSEGGWTPAA